MSNNQWNTGQGEHQWPEQGSDATNPAPQPSAPEWNPDNQAPGSQGWDAAPPNQAWNSQGHGQPAQGEWAGQRQDWSTGAQPQPSATDWNQQQGWAGAPGQQGWDPQQQGWGQAQQGAHAYAGQQWQAQPSRTPSPFAHVFDFGFKKFALPEAAGTIFLIAVIAIAVKWVFDVAYLLTYSVDVVDVMQVVIGGLAMSLLYILLVRIFLEGMSALVSRSRHDKDTAGDAEA